MSSNTACSSIARPSSIGRPNPDRTARFSRPIVRVAPADSFVASSMAAGSTSLALGHDDVDQPDRGGLVAVESFAEHHHAQRPGGADDARKALGTAGAREQSQLDLREPDHRIGRGHAEVAGKCELGAAAQRIAADRGDHGFRHGLDGRLDVDPPPDLLVVLRAEVPHHRHVGAGAERLVGPRDDHSSDLGIRAQLFGDRTEPLDGLQVDRVHRRAVEHHHGHRALALHGEVAHSSTPAAVELVELRLGHPEELGEHLGRVFPEQWRGTEHAARRRGEPHGHALMQHRPGGRVVQLDVEPARAQVLVAVDEVPTVLHRRGGDAGGLERRCRLVMRAPADHSPTTASSSSSFALRSRASRTAGRPRAPDDRSPHTANALVVAGRRDRNHRSSPAQGYAPCGAICGWRLPS